ncbi:calcium-binding protein [Herbaspirillum huttiense]|uniref:Calcium-binding protein n=2 Tax=Herbaspirillum huttiense TaxID=863372 RepID=A0AAJ2HD11_9BURK|nr:calcium-binding protein [Herbaspirillum huttiense]MDR9838196.1 calcium-binding protein [Herbaspirillum huttiense]
MDTNQIKPDSAPAGSYSAKIANNTEKLWEGIHAYDPSYANWLPNTGGHGLAFKEEHFGRNGTVRTYTNGVRYIVDADNGTLSWIVPNPDTGKITTTFQNLVTGETSFKTVPMESKADPVPPKPTETVSIKSFTEAALNGHKLITTTQTGTGAVSYQLRNPDGSLSNANIAANGSLSFYSDGMVQVFNNNKYVGRFTLGASTGTLADGTSGNFRYDAASGQITRSSSNIGGLNVTGFAYTDRSNNGLRWSDRSYQFSDVNAANSADHAAWAALANGALDKSGFENFVNASTDYLLNNQFSYKPGVQYVPSFPLPDLFPIGAFYESRSTISDKAESVAQRSFRILNSSNLALTALQLGSFDTNRDGQLNGGELNGLTAWVDSNEDGVAQMMELTSLSMAMMRAGLNTLRSGDYAFHTAGNASFRTEAQQRVTTSSSWEFEPMLPWAQFSRYDFLRRIDDTYYVNATDYIQFGPNQVKINNSSRDSLIGTDGNDSFDANYYAAYNGVYFNTDLLVKFYAGAGNDTMGGSVRNDTLWGGTGNDTLWGYEGNDTLYGEEDNDELIGGAGNDVLDGGSGNDTLFGQVGNDTLIGAEGNDELQGGDGNDALHGGAGHDKLFGQAGDDTLYGGDGNDVLVGFTPSNDSKQTLAAGESDNDTLRGGRGDDSLYGGLGNDNLDGGDDNDLIFGDAGNDTLLGSAGEDELDGGAGNDSVDGGAGIDKIFGGVGNDTLRGGSGDDILVGFTPSNDSKQSLLAGETDDDTLYGGAGDDFIIGAFGNDQMWGGIGNDEAQGGLGDDQLYGEEGNDRLFGGAGNDLIYGGNGDDIIVGGAAVNEAALAAGVSDSNLLYGGAGNDIIIGGIGNDFIDGGAGADKMEGGKGDDLYIVNSVNDVILEHAAEGYDTVVASSNAMLGANVEELRLMEGGSFNGTGNSGANKLIGNSQANILDGVTGADLMIGGQGNDIYYVDDLGDRVVELAGEGSDTVLSSISHTLGAQVENLGLLDFSKPEKGIADGVDILVYGYPKANELDYMQGNAVRDYAGTCALTSIANLGIQANQNLSEAKVVQRAIDNKWCVTDSAVSDYERGGSNYVGQRALLDSYGIRNGLMLGYNEEGIANLIKGGRGVIIALNAGKLWGESAYVDGGGVNHVVTVTGVACDARTGSINGFYIADSGRGLVSDMTRYLSVGDFRRYANVANAYSIYTIDPIKLRNENIDGAGNELANIITGNRGDNVLTGGRGNDTLIGQAGNDTYRFTRGDGTDTIVDSDMTVGNIDVLELSDIHQQNLWFRHVGDDLQINVMGTADQIVVKGWYGSGAGDGAGHIERIKTADGLNLHDTDVEQFVQAMAGFAPPTASQTSWTNGQSSNGRILMTVTH